MSVVISHLSKVFGTQKAVNDISFEAKEGEIIGFLGPNGAGKSTTMKITTCFLPPTSGKVEVCGYDVVHFSKEVRQNIGYLPEHNPLYLEMYVKEYLEFIGHIHQIKGNSLQKRINEMIALYGLGLEQHKKIGALSKGYRQRVGLAQAMMHNPKVLILDEPTTGLDPNQIVEIRQVIKDSAENKTIIFSTHIMQEVQAICSRAIIINLGQIVADSPVSELKNIQQAETIIFLETAQAIDISLLQALEGVLAVKNISENHYEIKSAFQTDLRRAISKLSVEQDWLIVGLKQEERTLENIFQQLTAPNPKGE